MYGFSCLSALPIFHLNLNGLKTLQDASKETNTTCLSKGFFDQSIFNVPSLPKPCVCLQEVSTREKMQTFWTIDVLDSFHTYKINGNKSENMISRYYCIH
jgi:hypothetical protein